MGWQMGVLLEKVEITFICFIVVDTIQGAFGFLEARKNLWEKRFIWRKRDCQEISCDVVHLLIALVIIEISFDLYLSVSSESIETHTLTNNGKYSMDGRLEKNTKAIKEWNAPNEISQRDLFQYIISFLSFFIFFGGLAFLGIINTRFYTKPLSQYHTF